MSRRSLRITADRVRRIRLGALFMLTLAAVAIACGVLLALLARGDTFYAGPVAIAFIGSAVLIGVATAGIRYARRLERPRS